MFYVKDKEPRTLDEVCQLYEKYKVLSDDGKRNHSRSLVQIVQDNDEFDDKKSNVVKQDDPITNMNNRIEKLFSMIDEIKRDKFENRNNKRAKNKYPKWTKLYDGPYMISKKISDVNFEIKKCNGYKTIVVHINKLKHV
ncbi:hypothetical protein HELRODRAFT_166829 [Helobdella robusta]|uniref:Integrase p58-like C-terminal domain-containing protein n=1 Tax=Helobdella robusta TaxID=6412 RepID=T1EYL2_HELRO|nr:hypothetical protein HELRODRAFT_166829 [Helobdella robusta]ESO11786.1 hypothetical protein HELRODRAFT_166829 [Helobdella robusta]